MQYQLPTGKVIYLSVEEYLAMSDQDLKNLEASNLGDYPTSPWAGSALRTPRKTKEAKDVDNGIDYTAEDDEVAPSISSCTTSIAFITIDEINSPETEEDDSQESDDT